MTVILSGRSSTFLVLMCAFLYLPSLHVCLHEVDMYVYVCCAIRKSTFCENYLIK